MPAFAGMTASPGIHIILLLFRIPDNKISIINKRVARHPRESGNLLNYNSEWENI
jgi:hypothetical protein